MRIIEHFVILCNIYRVYLVEEVNLVFQEKRENVEHPVWQEQEAHLEEEEKKVRLV